VVHLLQTPRSHPPAPALVADIGGSTSRFALAVTGQRPQGLLTLRNDTVPNIEAAIAHYLERVDGKPEVAVFAVAGPINGEDVKLTNRDWCFRIPALAARFGFDQFRVINDFEALAFALPLLDGRDTRPIGPHLEAARGAKAVLGPGTGLGVAALVPIDGRWNVVPSEGGHAAFGPQADDEEPVFARLRAECHHVSAETVLSGPGLARLHRALHQRSEKLTSEAIVGNARSGDAAARATVALFVRLLGRFAGDVALTFKATGGVYIAGGVAMALGVLFDDALFRAAIEAHPPYEKMLAAVPSYLITCEEPGLLGCAAVVEKLVGIENLREA
jgi:glucokinase